MLETYIRSTLKEKNILLMTHIVVGYPSMDGVTGDRRTMVGRGGPDGTADSLFRAHCRRAGDIESQPAGPGQWA
jgi:hypothetical protein